MLVSVWEREASNLFHSRKPFAVFILLSFAFSLIMLPKTLSLVSATKPSDNSFSIMQISDTQYLSMSYPNLFSSLTTWIVDNSPNFNLQMVIHTGDIVDNSSDLSQWVNANNSMSVLLNAGIPYCWNAGNHDQIPSSDRQGTWLGSGFVAFNSSIACSKNYWVDDIYNAKNTAVRFDYGSFPFLVVNLEYLANNSALAWMEDLLNKSSGSNVVIATHDYLNGTIGYGYNENPPAWELNLKKILDRHSNVFLTLNGHDNGLLAANMTRVGNREEIYFNRQSLDGLKGSASARIYTFNLTSMQVSVQTYVVYTQTFLTDPYNQFTFNASLLSDTAHNIFPYSYFWVASTYKQYISFSVPCYAESITLQGSAWNFANLFLNGLASNLTVTPSGVNMAISSYDPNGWVNYTINGRGTQTLTANKPPTAAYINGNLSTDGWTYQNGTLIVTSADSTVALNFQTPINSQTANQPGNQTPAATSTPAQTTNTTSESPTLLPQPSQTPESSNSTSPSPPTGQNAVPQTSQPLIQTAAWVVSAVAVVVAGFTLVLKKRGQIVN